MSTHNICFHEEIRKISRFFSWKKNVFFFCFVFLTMFYHCEFEGRKKICFGENSSKKGDIINFSLTNLYDLIGG